jgi:hypothetical protein
MVFIDLYWQGNDLTVQENGSGQIVNNELQQGLAALGLMVNEYGVLEVGTLKAKKLVAEELEMRDKATGEIYCTWIESGEWVKLKGECVAATSTIIQEIGSPNISATSSDAVCENGANRACSSDVGDCRIGVEICEQGVWGECIGATFPTEEICDGVDNNCNGEIDEDSVCSSVATSTEPVVNSAVIGGETTTTDQIATTTQP